MKRKISDCFSSVNIITVVSSKNDIATTKKWLFCDFLRSEHSIYRIYYMYIDCSMGWVTPIIFDNIDLEKLEISKEKSSFKFVHRSAYDVSWQ
jgi:hypothetical protein